LAWLLLGRGGRAAIDEGLALAEEVVKEAPDSAAALDTLARLLLARGEPTQALERAQRAVNLAPLDPTVRVGFARVLDALGRKRDASNQYEVSLLLSAAFEGRADVEKRLVELRAAK